MHEQDGLSAGVAKLRDRQAVDRRDGEHLRLVGLQAEVVISDRRGGAASAAALR